MTLFNRHASRRLIAISGALSGSEGPLRSALNELSRVGIGERILKSAIAATLAWLAADQIPRQSAPFVAALTALYTIDLTLLRSLTAAWQRLAGIALGIAMAFAAGELLGVHAWSVGLVILVSLTIGFRLNLKTDGMAQVAATAVLVLVVRSTTSERGVYSLDYLADTVIGTAIGLGVNAFLAPPNPLPRAEKALQIVVNRLIAVLDQLATMLVGGITRPEAEELAVVSAQVRVDLANVNTALATATESMRFNLIAIRQQAQLDHFHSIERRLVPMIEALNRSAAALGAASAEPWMRERAFTETIANLVSAVSWVVLGQGAVSSSDHASDAAIAELMQRMYELDRAAEFELLRTDDIRWTYLGQVVANCRELADAVLALNRTPTATS